MKELVSRQVVLAEVREWFDQRGIDGEHLLAVLEQIPSEGGWVSVEERLPEEGEKVIVLGVRGGMQTGIFRGARRNHKWEWKKHTVLEVVCWMPQDALPEPPKEDAHG